jgi:hypothetical protein
MKYEEILNICLKEDFGKRKDTNHTQGEPHGIKLNIEPNQFEINTFNCNGTFKISTGIGVIFADKIIIDKDNCTLEGRKDGIVFKCVLDHLKKFKLEGFVTQGYLRHVNVHLA